MSYNPNGVENTDRQLYSDDSGSIHVTKNGGIGINVGGYVIVRPLLEWHKVMMGADTFIFNGILKSPEAHRYQTRLNDIEAQLQKLAGKNDRVSHNRKSTLYRQRKKYRMALYGE